LLSIKLVLLAAEIAAVEAMMTLAAITAPGVKTRTRQKIKARSVSPLQPR
jgi:hypothetical protein